MRFFTLLGSCLRAALDCEKSDSFTADCRWSDLYETSYSHGVETVVLDGINTIIDSDSELAASFDSPDNEDLKFEWYGGVLEVEEQNANANERVKELSEIFSKGGFRCCVLKGQGNALYYPHPEHRQSGDIDMWVEGDREDILKFVTGLGVKIGHVDIKHSDMDFFPDVPVEIHFNPSYSYNPFIGHRLRKWTDEQAKVQFSLYDEQVGFTHPSTDFNLVYCLLHIYRHLFSEGVGLRQVVDYFCILKSSDSVQRQKAYETLRLFRMKRFTSGMMWVLKEISSFASDLAGIKMI